jgi:endonuclease/exonuclease/phosphatase family metal-dependent hydrolase
MKKFYCRWGKLLLLLLMLSLLNACGAALNYVERDSPKYVGHLAISPSSSDGTIKVITFNLKYAKELALAVQEFRAWPSLLNADVILLQEMDWHGTQEMASVLGYNYLYYPASIHPWTGKLFGNAILSKWPISRTEKLMLPYTNPLTKQQRIAAAATVTVDDLPVRVYSIHLETILLSRAKRLEQVRTILEHIESQEGPEHYIIGGDFNMVGAREISLARALFSEAGFESATLEVGATAVRFLRLDHIYTKGMQLLEAGKETRSISSDHIPVWAVLEVLPPGPGDECAKIGHTRSSRHAE